MPKSYNKWSGIGHLARDIEQRFLPNGTSVGKFTVACGHKWKDKQSGEWKEDTAWIPVVWFNCPDGILPFLLKGKPVFVEGRISTRTYDDKEGRKVYVTEVNASEVILLGSKGDEPVPIVSAPKSPAREVPQGIDVDDLPF